MTDNVQRALLEHMKRFQASLDRVEQDVRDLKTRQDETLAALLDLPHGGANGHQA